MRTILHSSLLCAVLLLAGCRTVPRPGTPVARVGDEIVVSCLVFRKNAVRLPPSRLASFAASV